MVLGLAYVQQGNLPNALVELQKASKLGSESGTLEPLALLGYAYARAGQKDEAEQILKELTRRSQQSYVPAVGFAVVYVGLGKKDQALTFLEKAYADRCPLAVSMVREPLYDPLRSEPRFVALLRRMGLEQ
jgi:Flp pilus assembly protein TadD